MNECVSEGGWMDACLSTNRGSSKFVLDEVILSAPPAEPVCGQSHASECESGLRVTRSLCGWVGTLVAVSPPPRVLGLRWAAWTRAHVGGRQVRRVDAQLLQDCERATALTQKQTKMQYKYKQEQN